VVNDRFTADSDSDTPEDYVRLLARLSTAGKSYA